MGPGIPRSCPPPYLSVGFSLSDYEKKKKSSSTGCTYQLSFFHSDPKSPYEKENSPFPLKRTPEIPKVAFHVLFQ